MLVVPEGRSVQVTPSELVRILAIVAHDNELAARPGDPAGEECALLNALSIF